MKVHVVRQGEGWLAVEGHPEKYHIKAGDCGLQTSGKPYIVAKDLSIKKRIKAEAIVGSARNGISTLNGGGDFYSITAHFGLEGHLPKILFSQLPPMIHIAGNIEPAAILRWSLELFSKEFHGNGEGRALILNHLAPVMLLQMLRVYLAANQKDNNWLAALSDPKLCKAIEAMHSDHVLSWSLEELARVAGMSRSGFALNFKKKVGLAPMDYLMNWRMQRACELLRSTDQNIAVIANGVGYESESAFSIAFKKAIGCRPGAYRKMPGSTPIGPPKTCHNPGDPFTDPFTIKTGPNEGKIETADGEIVSRDDPSITVEHVNSAVEHWNTTGYNSSREVRNDFYNDVNNMTIRLRRGSAQMATLFLQVILIY